MRQHTFILTVKTPAAVGANNTLTVDLSTTGEHYHGAKAIVVGSNHTVAIDPAAETLTITEGSDGFTGGKDIDVIIQRGHSVMQATASNV